MEPSAPVREARSEPARSTCRPENATVDSVDDVGFHRIHLLVWVGGLDSWNPLMKGIGILGCTP